MHSLRNALPATARNALNSRALSSAATAAAQSVIPESSTELPNVKVNNSTLADAFGYKHFKEFAELDKKSPLSKKRRKKLKNKIGNHATVLAGADHAASKGKAKSKELISALKGMANNPGIQPERPTKWVPYDAAKAKEKTHWPASTKSIGSTSSWKDNWGVDQLRPKLDTFRSQKPLPPHIRSPLGYTRRVEGLLQTEGESVLEDVAPVSEHRPIATLEHKLDRVLFNSGVHWMKDPRTGVYNFTPWLENIPDVNTFAFERLTGFIKSSRDEDLWALAKREGRTFSGSTSSLSGMLSHAYFLISGDRSVDISPLSRHFQDQPTTFTPGQRMPAYALLNYKDGVYAVDSFSENDDPDKNVLTWMGTLLEKFLTVPPKEFNRFIRDSPNPADPDADNRREAYRYAKSKKFVMRSQLDCYDPRLPGTGVFDLKTRAALPIRLDMLNYQAHSGYTLRHLQGPAESFEKEYYDLIRSAFLKYSFQARIGNMDGVMVAYHNAARIFGFQYVPLTEMEERLYGDSSRGDRVFEKCVTLLEEVLTEATLCFPEQSIRCLVEKLEGKGHMRVWVEPEEYNVDADGPRPIAQLDIRTDSYINGMEVRGSTAVASDQPWDLHWSISRSSVSDVEKRANKQAAVERKFRAWNLPSGVDIDAMEDIWNKIDYGGKRQTNGDTAVPSNFDPAYFKAATLNVEKLRELSRKGREDAEELELRMQGRPKIILGDAVLERDTVVSKLQVLPQERALPYTLVQGVKHWTGMVFRKHIDPVNLSQDLSADEIASTTNASAPGEGHLV